MQGDLHRPMGFFSQDLSALSKHLAEIEHLGLCNPADYDQKHEHATTTNATHGLPSDGTSDGSCTCEESGASHHRRLAGGDFHSYQVKGSGFSGCGI